MIRLHAAASLKGAHSAAVDHEFREAQVNQALHIGIAAIQVSTVEVSPCDLLPDITILCVF